MIDVDDILTDPDLLVSFDVVRRKENVSSQGRSSTDDQTITGLSGTITAAGENALSRLPEADRMERHISIVTNFMLRGASKVGSDVYKPDVVLWNNVEWIVLDVQAYPEAGNGFVQAIAGSGDIVDEAS